MHSTNDHKRTDHTDTHKKKEQGYIFGAGESNSHKNFSNT